MKDYTIDHSSMEVVIYKDGEQIGREDLYGIVREWFEENELTKKEREAQE
jgi:hypothetical protein